MLAKYSIVFREALTTRISPKILINLEFAADNHVQLPLRPLHELSEPTQSFIQELLDDGKIKHCRSPYAHFCFKSKKVSCYEVY